MLNWLANLMYRRLGRNLHGDGCPNPPGDRLRVELPYRGSRPDYLVAATSNDGFDLLVGSPDEWHLILEPKQARRLAWFVLWNWWFLGTWFGLRRALWYWALNRKLMASRQVAQPPPG